MPWTAADAPRHTKKATTKKLREAWAHVANATLERSGSDALAVREANGIVRDRTERATAKSVRDRTARTAAHSKGK